MNRYFTIVMSFTIMVFLFSCSKGEHTPSSSSPSSPSYYSMSATIVKQADTTLFSAIGPVWVTDVDSNYGYKIIAIDTADSAYVSKFTFVIYDFGGIGTYKFDSIYVLGDPYADYETINPTYTQTNFATCTLKITNYTSGYVSGIFNGTLTDGSVVTNGAFTAFSRRPYD